jgi:hypothetical protein
MTEQRQARWAWVSLCAGIAALVLGSAPAASQTYVVDPPEQRLRQLQREEASLLRLRAEYARQLADESVLFLDRPMRPGSGSAEDELAGRGLRRIPVPTARTNLRNYLAFGLLAGLVTGADPIDLAYVDVQAERLWAEWEAEDQRIRQYLTNIVMRDTDARLHAVRAAASEILAARQRPQPQSGGWRLVDVIHGVQSETRSGLHGGHVSVGEIRAGAEGGSASIRVRLTRGCTESYTARWSFSEPVEWLSRNGGTEVQLTLERTSSSCPVNLYAAELEARGSQGTVPLRFTTLPRPALQATSTRSLRSAQIGGTWQGPTQGAGSIGFNLGALPSGSYDSAYFFINIMARSDLSDGGSVHYRVAYVYGPD